MTAASRSATGCTGPVHDEQWLAGALSRLADPSDIAQMADVFALLADPGRLRLLSVLLEGEACVCDLAAACGQSESAVSHALRLLRAHRVVTVRRTGRRAFYRLDDLHVRMLLDLALTHVSHASAVRAVDGPEQVR